MSNTTASDHGPKGHVYLVPRPGRTVRHPPGDARAGQLLDPYGAWCPMHTTAGAGRWVRVWWRRRLGDADVYVSNPKAQGEAARRKGAQLEPHHPAYRYANPAPRVAPEPAPPAAPELDLAAAERVIAAAEYYQANGKWKDGPEASDAERRAIRDGLKAGQELVEIAAAVLDVSAEDLDAALAAVD